MKLWFKKPVESVEEKPSSETATAGAESPRDVAITLDVPAEQLPAVTDRSRDARPPQTSYRSDHKSLYKQLLAGLYDAVLVTDPKGYIIDANARVQEFFQYDGSETWDMAVGELIPGVNAALIERIRKGLSGDRFVLLDARCIRKDRTTFAAEVAISSIDLMNEGDFVFAVRNVDRRRSMIQKLRGSYSALMQALSADAICDREGKVKVANAAMLALLGLAREDDLLGKPITSLWAQDADGQNVVSKVLAGAKWQGAIQAVARDGRRFTVKAQLSPERDGRDGVVGFVCSFIECPPARQPSS